MASILDLVAENRYRFLPNTRVDFLVLRMVHKLDDISNLRDYRILSEHYPDTVLITTFRKCIETGNVNRETFMSIFHQLTTER